MARQSRRNGKAIRPKRQHSYSMAKKELIVAEAYSIPNNVKATARCYEVQGSNIRQWKKRIAFLKRKHDVATYDRIKQKKQFGGGSKPKHPEVFDDLMKYFEGLREQHRVVSVNMLCAEYKRLSNELSSDNQKIRQRIYRWMEREGIVDRKITHQAQNTRHCDTQMADFVSYINERVEMLGIPWENVVNGDETNIDFSLDSSRTLNKRGSRTVSVKQAKSSQRATALLVVSQTGEKLKPFLIFKGKPGRTGRVSREFANPNLVYPSTIAYTVQQKAWMDEERMIEWIEDVWRPWCNGRGTTYLILDEFSAHMTAKVQRTIESCGTILDFIIAGYTSKLQPLDVGVNKPFKGYMRERFEMFMVKNDIITPHRMEVAQWVHHSWNSIM